MSADGSADIVEKLADQVERLTVDRHDPERFFEDRSEIVFRLREEARRLRRTRDGQRSGARLTSGTAKGTP